MNGPLGKVVTSSSSLVNPYTVPSSGVDFTTLNIRVLNVTLTEASVNVYLSTSSIPSSGDLIVWKAVIAPNGGALDINCEVVGPGEHIIVESTVSDLVVRVSGLEKLSTGPIA